jgi:thioesterase domain-containing protein
MEPDNLKGTLRLFRSVAAGRDWVRSLQVTRHSSLASASILIRSGDEDPPVFIIPGASGSILELGPLVSNLRVSAPVYAPLMKGLNAGETPCMRVEDIAEYCIATIIATNTNGPYFLIGYSLGGVIALEIAHRLTLAGQRVPLVVLLGSYPSEKVWPLSCHLDILRREITKSLSFVTRQSLPNGAYHIANRCWGLFNYLLRMVHGISYLAPVAPDQVSVAARRLYLATLEALKHYRPPTYDGRVVFIVTAEKNTLDPETPHSVWRKYLSNLEVRRVTGSHLTMIGDDAANTAREISDVLGSARLARKVIGRSVRAKIYAGGNSLNQPALMKAQSTEPWNNGHANGSPQGDRGGCAYSKVIDRICRLSWETIDHQDVMKIAKVYYYFSIQFRENLELACRLHPNDALLEKLYRGECNTDNLSPWPGVTRDGERLNHDEFMRRLLALEPLDHLDYLDEVGFRYLSELHKLDEHARVASIATYEDGGLSKVFSAMLRAPQWQGVGQQAFKFFLREHIRFDMDVGNGHGALARHLGADDSVLPLWLGFKEILLEAVPKLGFAQFRMSATAGEE